jgi:beta-1,4-mannosyl-glycoprotein beta-1,4-N-acetylglucosaminyltransferase
MRMFPDRRIQRWTIGSDHNDMAGWHCSWCLDAEGIRVKLVSAQNGDFPRWGDYPEKCNITYIKRLVATGTWFDDVSTMKRRDVISGPPSLMKNRQKYNHMVTNVYRRELEIDEYHRATEYVPSTANKWTTNKNTSATAVL